MKQLLIAALVAAAVGVSGSALAHCPDNPPTILSSYTALDESGAPIAESPSVDTGSLHCGSERTVPRTIPAGANTFRVRSGVDVAPASGTLQVGASTVALSFTRVVAPTGSVSYDSAPVYVADAHGTLTATVCISDSCKSASFAAV